MAGRINIDVPAEIIGMELKFVYNEPVAGLADALVIGDVHLGIEYELQRKGYNLALQYRKVAEKINALLKQTKATTIIFLGDLKHDVYGMKGQEERMLNAFFRLLKAKRIIVCKGNHDSHIEDCKGIEVAAPEGLLYEDTETLLLHGHALPDATLLKAAKTICFGHEHALAQIEDGKHASSQKIWIVGVQNKKKFIIFPHFGDLVGGREFDAGKPLNRFLTKAALKKADAYLLSGLKLGKLGKLA